MTIALVASLTLLGFVWLTVLAVLWLSVRKTSITFWALGVIAFCALALAVIVTIIIVKGPILA